MGNSSKGKNTIKVYGRPAWYIVKMKVVEYIKIKFGLLVFSTKPNIVPFKDELNAYDIFHPIQDPLKQIAKGTFSNELSYRKQWLHWLWTILPGYVLGILQIPELRSHRAWHPWAPLGGTQPRSYGHDLAPRCIKYARPGGNLSEHFLRSQTLNKHNVIKNEYKLIRWLK